MTYTCRAQEKLINLSFIIDNDYDMVVMVKTVNPCAYLIYFSYYHKMEGLGIPIACKWQEKRVSQLYMYVQFSEVIFFPLHLLLKFNSQVILACSSVKLQLHLIVCLVQNLLKQLFVISLATLISHLIIYNFSCMTSYSYLLDLLAVSAKLVCNMVPPSATGRLTIPG